jgi:acylphosphatase
MTNLASIRVIVYGRVQGIGFRFFTRERAKKLELTGYVRNLPDRGMVEVAAEGEKDRLESLVEYLKAGPPGARVERVDVNWLEYAGRYPDFSVRY